MNQITVQPAPAVYVPGLSPASMTEAMKLAEMMATAQLVPAALQKSPADCLMVVMQAARWQMDPFAVAQECSVISGKLMHSGKLVAAVVNARGDLEERLSFDYAGQGDARTITVSGRLRGETKPRTVTVRLGEAKTVNKVWQTQPDQQLMYHGCRVWARRHTPELMLGVYSPEEFDAPPQQGNGAMRDVTPTVAPAAAPVEQTTDELKVQMLRSIAAMTDVAKYDAWKERHKQAFARLSEEDWAIVQAAAKSKRAELAAPVVEHPEPGEVIDDPAPDLPHDDDGVVPSSFEEWLSTLGAAASRARNQTELEEIWKQRVKPYKHTLIPPDQDTVDALYVTHETRLAL